MLQARERPRVVASRIKGQTAITNWLQLLLVRTRWHANHRPATNAERARAGVTAAVQSAFEVPTPGERNYPRAPVRKSDRLLKMQADFDTLTK
jgi:hypothetical protein